MQTEETAPSSENVGENLLSNWVILRRIFSYLPMEDLQNVSLASDQCKRAVDVTKKERLNSESFVISEQKYQMSSIWTEAKCILSFCTTNNQELQEQVLKYQTSDCTKLVCIANSGVMGTTHDLSQIIQQKIRVGIVAPRKFYLTSLRIPAIPNVGVKILEWRDGTEFEDFTNNFHLPDNNIVKCLLILMVEYESRRPTAQKDHFITFLRGKQEENFAVGGCIVDDFNEDSGNLRQNCINKYIVFYGSNIDTSSTVLTSDIKTVSSIQNKVEKFRKKSNFSKNGILFIFRCAGRQRVLRRYHPNINDINKWESEAILKYFPNTPAVGCLGYGEYGNEFPDDVNSVSPQKKFKYSELCEYSFSTSLVYISIRK